MSKESRPTRTLEKKIEINTPIEHVWKALTDAEELMRWFPLDAKVKPQEGGSVWFSWGPPYEGENNILIWDPPQRLRLRDRSISHGSPSQVSMEFLLENSGGKTILRLVHAGFEVKSDWDDEFDATNRGWDFEFGGLKHYLEQHRGEDRKVVWARMKADVSREEAWSRVLGPNGLLQQGTLLNLGEGEHFVFTTENGETLEGVVVRNDPPADFWAILKNWNNAYFRVSIERWSAPQRHVEPNLWVSTYGLTNSRVLLLQDSWSKMLAKLFPEEFRP